MSDKDSPIKGGKLTLISPDVVLGPPAKKALDSDLTAPVIAEQRFAQELHRLDVQYDYGTKQYSIPEVKGQGARIAISESSLFDRLILRGNLDLGEGLSHETLGRYLRLWREARENAAVGEIRKSIAPVDREAGQAELARWLNLICDEGHKLSQVIMTQWIWLVRNKLAGRWGDSHVMPVLSGGQGGGKTKAITALTKPLGPLASIWTFEEMVDTRNWLELSRCYVGYIEELAGARRSQLGVLKGLITAQYRDVRLFHTQDRTKVRVATSWIGDTNGMVSEIIKDSTGARRFWEVRCKDDIDVDKLYTFDYKLIWGCVHEDDPCPTQSSEHFGTIKDLQNRKLRHMDPIAQWIEDTGYGPGECVVPTEELYEKFRRYCASEGLYYSGTKSLWSRTLNRQYRWENKVVKIKGKPVRCLFVNSRK